MPRTQENSLPHFRKNKCHFFRKSTCRLQQSSFRVKLGETRTLSVTATATNAEGITYEWSDRNGTIEGAESATYTIPPITGYQYYHCTVKDIYGNYQRVSFYVYVDNAFEASAVNSRQQVEPGQKATLEVNVAATDTSKVTYEWRDAQNKVIEGESASIFVTPAIEGSTRYTCIVNDGYGNNQYVYFSVGIQNNLSVTTGQNSLSVKVGEITTLSVTVTATNTEGITYVWRDKNGVIEGAEAASYTTLPVTEYQYYYCTVKDVYGNSQTAYFYVQVDNAFSAQAANARQQVEPGQKVTLEVNVTATDTSKVTYEWIDAQNEVIEGADASTFVTPAIEENVRYICLVSDGYGNSQYVYFSVVVDNNLNVTVEQNFFNIKIGGTATLSVTATATNTEGITYVWSDKNGVIEGAVSASYTTLPVAEYQYYRCTVKDTYGNSITASFYVYVDNAFSVQAVKASQQVEPGQTATLEVNVSATDTSKVTYEWKDADHNTIEGATSNKYVTPEINEYEVYYCVVNDGYGNRDSVQFDVELNPKTTATALLLDQAESVSLTRGNELIYFTYTPEKTGVYVFSSSTKNSILTSGSIYDKDLTILRRSYYQSSSYEFSLEYYLKAGETYYFSAGTYYNYIDQYQVILTEKEFNPVIESSYQTMGLSNAGKDGYYQFTGDAIINSTSQMQIPCPELNGFYILNNNSLNFCSLASLTVVPVCEFQNCKGYYASGSRLYFLSTPSVDGGKLTYCGSYDLLEKKYLGSFTVLDYNGVAIGVDALNRVYLSATDDDNNYHIFLLSEEGKVLSDVISEKAVFAFLGFDSDSGDFFMESYYNLETSYYSIYGRAVTVGNVTDNTLSFKKTSTSAVIDDTTYTIECLEYLHPQWGFNHQRGAALIGDGFLVTSSNMLDRVRVFNATDLSEIFSINRSEEENIELNHTYDYESVGIRAIYHPSHNNAILYENGKILREYNLADGSAVANYSVQNIVYDMMWMNDSVIALERNREGTFFLEVISWKDPTSLHIEGANTMKAGDIQTLTGHVDATFNGEYVWSTSDETVISISQDGIVSSWKEGEVIITCSSDCHKLEATFKIQVQNDKADIPYKTEAPLGGVTSNNISNNNYRDIVYSYLYEETDGKLVRVEYVRDKGVLIESYSSDKQLLDSFIIELELTWFGGFYSGNEFNYLVFGQANYEESDSVEVLRVVRYSKNWDRLNSTSIFGANTYAPFTGGSLRMAEKDGKLYIHTCHSMYLTSDGLHHQANMTFVLDSNSLEQVDANYYIANIELGYVSHSFDQFIATDDCAVYRVDLGDSYPRAVSLTRCEIGASITQVSFTNALTIQGQIGANATGVSVGGLELSTNNCVIAGNSVDQSDPETYSARGQRNIFVSIVSKDMRNSEVVWLTDYSSDEGITPYTPHLVKLNEDQFLVLWEEEDVQSGAIHTRVTTINGSGVRTSDIRKTTMRLSDCKPILCQDGLVRWYVTDGNSMTMYELNPYSAITQPVTGVSLDKTSMTVRVTKTESLIATVLPEDADNQKVSFTSSNPEIATVSEDGTVTGVAAGSAVITVTTAESGYTATCDVTVELLPLGNVTLSATSFTYNGERQRPTVTVQDEDGTVLTEGTDYTLTFTGNQINAQSVKAIVSGKGKYTGVLAPIYTIQPAPLTKLELKQESMVYTGAKLCPEETVTNSAGTVLIKDTDYQVSYSKNVNAGEATITVSGLKNYTGSLSATFTIVPTSISDVTVSLETTSYVYDGKEKKPNVTVKNALGLTLSPETDYTVSYENNINKGTATVKVTGKGNYSGTKTATFSITAAPLQSMALEAESMVYTGKELKPNVTVKNSAGTVLTLDTDYTVSYANNIRIGTAKVTVTGKDNYTGTLEATFKIKLPFTDVPDDYAYYDELADIYMRGLMTGMTPTTFGPETTLNRAFMAAVLFRRAGYPATPYRDIFPDVKEGDWFAESALWAQASGNILGYENGKFGPTDNLLREQLCTILWRYAETTDGFDNTARADLTVYSDYTRITPYAEEAISWCVATGIFETRNGRIAAWEVATRAELALMLSRYLKVAGK